MKSDMKSHLLMRASVICGLVVPFAGAQVAPPAQVPISVTISAPSLEVKAGSEFKVEVVMTNTSDEPVHLSMHPEDFRVDIRDSDGRVVGKAKVTNEFKQKPRAAEDGPPVIELAHGSYEEPELGAHKVERWEEIVGKNLDLSKPGKYTIQVTRMYGKTPVKSNTITITVVQ